MSPCLALRPGKGGKHHLPSCPLSGLFLVSPGSPGATEHTVTEHPPCSMGPACPRGDLGRLAASGCCGTHHSSQEPPVGPTVDVWVTCSEGRKARGGRRPGRGGRAGGGAPRPAHPGHRGCRARPRASGSLRSSLLAGARRTTPTGPTRRRRPASPASSSAPSTSCAASPPCTCGAGRWCAGPTTTPPAATEAAWRGPRGTRAPSSRRWTSSWGPSGCGPHTPTGGAWVGGRPPSPPPAEAQAHGAQGSGSSGWCHVSPELGTYCVPGVLCYARRRGLHPDLAPAFFLGLLVDEDPEVGFG